MNESYTLSTTGSISSQTKNCNVNVVLEEGYTSTFRWGVTCFVAICLHSPRSTE